VIRLFNAYFPARTVLLGTTEAILVSLSFIAATVIWAGRDAELVLAYEGGATRIAVVTIVFVLSMYYLDLYDSLVISNRREIGIRLLQMIGVGTTVMAVIYYIYPDVSIRLDMFAVGLTLTLVLIGFWRQMFLWMTRSFHLCEHAIILGSGPLATELADEVRTRPELGINLLGFVSSDSTQVANGLRHLGDVSVLSDLVRKQRVRRIILTLGERRGNLPLEELLALKTNGILVQDGVDVYEAFTGKVPLKSLRLGWLLFSSGFHVSRPMLLYKRFFSIVCSLVGLMATIPVMVLVWLAIRFESPGPVIYRQKRVGKDGRCFTLYKFRSMHIGSDARGCHRPAEDNDERFTRVGKLLRRTRLDELPQMFNILRGDMDFVGPRPFVPDQEAELVKAIPHYRHRWSVKPGATGWAQIHFHYCASLEDNAEKLAYDLFYIKNMSVGLDILILFKTVKILLLGRGGR
jgi:sugar transferase (PEP-CTERM system associated)